MLASRGIGRTQLDWSTRLEIIKDIAKVLTSLHNSFPSHKVPRPNLRTSSVLIHQDDDQVYHSKLTDYGFFALLSASH